MTERDKRKCCRCGSAVNLHVLYDKYYCEACVDKQIYPWGYDLKWEDSKKGGEQSSK